MTEDVLVDRALRHAKLPPVTSVDQDNPQAALVNEILGDVIDEALQEQWDWSFARRRKALSMIPDLTYAQWEYAYSLPDDMVQVRKFCETDSSDALESDQYELFEYRDDTDRSGSRLATDLDEIYIVYTGSIRTVPHMPLYFANAVSWLLAHYLADAFGGSERSIYCRQIYNTEIMVARGKDDQRERQSMKGSFTLLED